MSEDASSRLWLYTIAFTPIALGHLLVPPISWFRGGDTLPEPLDEMFERIYDIVPEPFLSERFVVSLILDNARVLKLDWTRISHIFVHVNYQHLLSNLSAAYQFGFPVYETLGNLGLYAIFILGGVYASLPSGLYTRQKESFARTVKDVISPEVKYLPSFAVEAWDALAGKVSTVASEFIPQKCCGSSGAVFALMGAQSVILVRNVLKLFTDTEPYPGIARRLNQSAAQSQRDDTNSPSWFQRFIRRLQRTHPVALAQNCFNMYRCYQYIYSEVKLVYDGSKGAEFIVKTVNTAARAGLGRMSLSDSVAKALDLMRVNHAAHIQGFLFGAAYAAFFGFVVPSVQRGRFAMI